MTPQMGGLNIIGQQNTLNILLYISGSFLERQTYSNSCQYNIVGLYGYGSIPIDTIVRGLFTSINPSYFDVNYRGTIGFDTLPYEIPILTF